MSNEAHKILIADDDASIRLVLSQAFSRLGYDVRATGNAATLLKWVSDGDGDLVITDVVMPDENVFNVLPRIRKQRPKLPVIVMSAQNTLLTAVSAAEVGVFDYIPKPFDLDDMTATAKRALARPADGEAAKAQARAVRDERLPLIGSFWRPCRRCTGPSPVWSGNRTHRADLWRVGIRARRWSRRRRCTTYGPPARRPLRLGQSGRGAARAWWTAGAVRCSAAASQSKLFEADGGTLFLDEISDMPLDSQIRLLRVFDGAEPAVNPKTGRKSDVRLIAATNRDLRDLVAQGLFREDLYFRLDVAPIRLPPLREHPEDIPELARAFLLRANREGLPSKTIDNDALERLKRHDWPGNVRELENLIRRVCALYADETITARIMGRELGDGWAPRGGEGPVSLATLVERHLAAQFASHADGMPPPGLYDRVLAEIERPLLQLTLAATRGNQVRAAEVLGLNRNTLRKRIGDLGIDTGRAKR